MAHKRKDTLVAPIDHVKHLRPFGKKRQASKERKAGVKELKQQLIDR